MPHPDPPRTPLRLPPLDYRRPGRTFTVTIGTSPRGPVFDDPLFGRECVQLLRDLRSRLGLRVFAYCLMPDRVHIVVEIGARSSLPEVVGAWKSLCYLARSRRGRPEGFWERSFHEHPIRSEESLRIHTRYVLENPVRAGLVRDFRDYPLCGSLEFGV